jgi:hypothetical protein
MQRVKLGFATIGVVVLLSGCQPQRTQVYVDTTRIASSEASPPVSQISPPVPPNYSQSLAGKTLELPEHILRDPSNTPKLNVQEMFDREQAKSFDALSKRLREFYRSEVSRFRLEQAQAVAGKETEAYRVINQTIRKAFLEWADERAPVFLKLTLVAGFPDPVTPPASTGGRPRPVEQNRLKTAQTLRTELQKIDAKFYAKCSGLLGEVLNQSSTELADMETRIEAFSNEMDRKAELEAKAQIRSAASHLEFKLADPAPVYVPGTPARNIPIATIPALDPAPRVPSQKSISESGDVKDRIEQEVRIWAALNRYDLVHSPKSVRNATEEFQQWRQRHGLGH